VSPLASRVLIVLLAGVLLAPVLAAPEVPDGAPSPMEVPAAVRTPSEVAALSGFFTENAGQVGNPEILYYARGGEVYVGFAAGAVLLNLRERPPHDELDPRLESAPPAPAAPLRGHLVRTTFEGANPVLPQGRGELPHRANFFLGDDPAHWHTNVRNFAEVIYENAWDGIDVVYRTSPGGAKYDLVVHPGADLADVAFAYEGVTDLAVTPHGLAAGTSLGPLRDDLPAAWQASGLPVECTVRRIADRTVGYACSGWDGTGDLVIDPLLYATFLGGSEHDYGRGIVVDASGAAYVTGFTVDAATDFPATPGAYDTTHNGGVYDAFVAKLNASGSALLYATFLGGSGEDVGSEIASDSSGAAYVTGYTVDAVTDFPTTPGAYDITHNGWSDAFVAKLDASGSALLYATFLGGSGYYDDGWGIAVDSSGAAYVTGETSSADFPTTPGAYDTTYNGGSYDAFVAKLNASGSTLLYATFLGGSGVDWGGGVAVNISGAAYVTGLTDDAATDFPVTPEAYDTTHNGGVYDAYVAKLDASGSDLVYATFLGGSGGDRGIGIDTDASGAAYLTGWTHDDATDFPTTPGAHDTTHNGGEDAFVAKLDFHSTPSLSSTGEVNYGTDGLDPETGAADVTSFVYRVNYTDADGDPPASGDPKVHIRKGGVPIAGSPFAMAAVDPLDADVTDGKWYAYAIPLALRGTDYTYYFTSGDAAGKAATDWPAPPADAPDLVNRGPTADAGTDQPGLSRNATVHLDGTGSSDPDGDQLAFAWTQTAGPLAALMGANTATPSFTPIAPGTYVLELAVDDGFGGTDADDVTVSVVDRAPIADAGGPYACPTGGYITLDGTGSTDPDGDALTYAWTVHLTPPVTLSGPTPTLTCPSTAGTVKVTLVVTDSGGLSSTDDATLSVQPRGGVSDWAWILLALAAVIALVLVVFVLLRRRRQKDETARPSGSPRMGRQRWRGRERS